MTNLGRGWYDVTNPSRGIAETGMWHRERERQLPDQISQHWCSCGIFLSQVREKEVFAISICIYTNLSIQTAATYVSLVKGITLYRKHEGRKTISRWVFFQYNVYYITPLSLTMISFTLTHHCRSWGFYTCDSPRVMGRYIHQHTGHYSATTQKHNAKHYTSNFSY